jgi:hypothetical protein
MTCSRLLASTWFCPTLRSAIRGQLQPGRLNHTTTTGTALSYTLSRKMRGISILSIPPHVTYLKTSKPLRPLSSSQICQCDIFCSSQLSLSAGYSTTTPTPTPTPGSPRPSKRKSSVQRYQPLPNSTPQPLQLRKYLRHHINIPPISHNRASVPLKFRRSPHHTQTRLFSTSGPTSSNPESSPTVTMSRRVLTLDNINPHVRSAQYAVRGLIPQKAESYRAQLAKGQGTHLPFDNVIFSNIGNPQQLDQQPITFFRQVASLLEWPVLLESEHVLEKQLAYKKDAIERAKRLLKEVKSVGAYSNSSGAPGIKQSVADFIERKSEPETLILIFMRHHLSLFGLFDSLKRRLRCRHVCLALLLGPGSLVCVCVPAAFQPCQQPCRRPALHQMPRLHINIH